MNIGFVTTWLERGATYVTKMYMNCLKDEHNLFVFARGGKFADKSNSSNDEYKDIITWGYRLRGTKIDWKQLSKWIYNSKIDIIFFNEQSEFEILYKIKKYMPNVILGSYIDYYKEDMISNFEIFDFLICNTKRHYSVFSWHPGVHYIPWGTDVDLFTYKKEDTPKDNLVFFHSMGMSPRKGTDILINAFIRGEFYKKKSKLIIHTQLSIDYLIKEDEAKKYGIEIIHKEVPAPGLYHLGDVYVYPTKLDGLGLTIYEAFACGLPVITTDEPPMNEVVNNEVGRLITVDMYRCRKDAYYWPLSLANVDSLIEAMNYYVMNRDRISEFRQKSRDYAVSSLNILDRKENIKSVFNGVQVISRDCKLITIQLEKLIKNRRQKIFRDLIEEYCPNRIKHNIRSVIENKRRKGL